eukprot:3372715-Ditylum_brightwellii.AAC.1
MHFYLANINSKEVNNGTILKLLAITQHVVASASESELVALFYSALGDVPFHIMLEEMGYPQLPIPLITNNNMAHELTSIKMIPKGPKVKYREDSKADSCSKHYPPKVH